MVHDYGPGRRFASVHVEMDYREDPMVCHEIIDDLERECMESHGVQLVIHYDPVVTDDPELERMKTVVTGILKDLDTRLDLHDFRMVPSGAHTNLIFDIVLPGGLAGQEKTIKNELDRRLNRDAAVVYYTVITFDPEGFNQ